MVPSLPLGAALPLEVLLLAGAEPVGEYGGGRRIGAGLGLKDVARDGSGAGRGAGACVVF